MLSLKTNLSCKRPLKLLGMQLSKSSSLEGYPLNLKLANYQGLIQISVNLLSSFKPVDKQVNNLGKRFPVFYNDAHLKVNLYNNCCRYSSVDRFCLVILLWCFKPMSSRWHNQFVSCIDIKIPSGRALVVRRSRGHPGRPEFLFYFLPIWPSNGA